VTRISTACTTSLLLVALPLHAQQFSLRLSGLRTQYADSLDARAGSASAQLAWGGARTSGVVEASWAQFNTGTSAGQAWGSFAAMGPRSRKAGLGLRLDGVSNAIEGSTWTATGSSEVFGALVLTRAWTLTTGLSVGGVRALDTSRFATAGASARSWYERGHWTIGAAATATTSSTARFADFTATADFHRGRVAAGVLAGGRQGDLDGPPWYQGRVTVRLTPSISLESALGSYPKDLAGYDRGRYANLGFRFRLSAPQPVGVDPSASLGTSARVLVQPLDSVSTLVTFALAGARAPAIAGSWNEWFPTPLTQVTDGRWSAILPVGVGVYRFAIIMDDGRWIVPEGVTRLPDDFDGEVGVLVVRNR